jgi:penicillin amidase
VPAPGWTGCCDWRAVRPLPEPATRGDSRQDAFIAANGDSRRTARVRDLLSTRPRASADDFKQWQHDTEAPFAATLVPLLATIRSDRADVERARERLVAWDRRVTPESPIATLYVMWEDALVRAAALRAFDAPIADDYVDLGRSITSRALDEIAHSRDRAIVLSALESAVADWHGRDEPRWGALHQVLFKHPLAVTDALQRRYSVGPFAVGGYDRTVMATYGRHFDVEGAASFAEILDAGDWDRSVVTNAPGQSGSPASAHFSDLARPWVGGEYFPLVFSDAAVQANAESTLRLVPSNP